MSKVNDAIAIIEGLTVTELVQLFNKLKEVFEITDNMLQVGAAPAGGNGASAETATAVDPNKKVSLVLSNIGGESKIAFIKAMKEVFNTAITEASAKFTEASAGTAVILQSDLSRKDAEDIQAKLKTLMAAATVDIK